MKDIDFFSALVVKWSFFSIYNLRSSIENPLKVSLLHYCQYIRLLLISLILLIHIIKEKGKIVYMDNYSYNKLTFRTCNKSPAFMAKDAHCINTSSYNTIIPFSSGISSSQMEFQFTIDSIETASILGFGTANNSVPIVDNKIDLTGTTSEAFTVPYDGNITTISASFSPLATFPDVPGPLTIRSQIFHAPAGSNIFTGTSAIVDLTPALTLPINSGGQIAFGSRDISPFLYQ